MSRVDSTDDLTASQRITNRIADLADWRGALFARLRELIRNAAPEVAEEWKWDTAVWTHGGLVCSVGVFKDHVKLNFFKGASLADPNGLFNAGLEAKATRAIDFEPGGEIDAAALAEPIRAAADFNRAGGTKR